MLSANIWSEVNAKAVKLNNGSVEIDVIHKKEVSEHIKFYHMNHPDLVDYYLDYMKEFKNNYGYVQGVESIDYIIASDCYNGGEFVHYLANQLTPIYLLPYGEYTQELFNVDGMPSVRLPNLPAYPINNCEITIENPIIDLETNDTVSNVSTYGFVYDTGTNIKDTLKEISVSYYVLKDEAPIYDENGFLSNDLDMFERVEEVLIRESEKVFAEDSDYLEDDVVMPNTFTDNYYDYNISPDGKKIIFNRQSETIQRLFSINAQNKLSFNTSIIVHYHEDNGNLTQLENPETVEIYDVDVHITLHSKELTEFYDYQVDYDTGNIEFFTPVTECDMVFTYNPLWVRGLGLGDFPLKMDLWTEKYRIGYDFNDDGDSITGIYKQVYDEYGDEYDGDFYETTNVNPRSNKQTDNTYFRFKTTVPPRDNIRKLILNEESDDGGVELIEDKDFFVDYITNTVILNYPNLEDGNSLTIKYTPNLTDTGLALGYRLRRPTYGLNEEMLYDGSGYVRFNTQQYESIADDVYILGNYFTYRT